MMQIGKVCRRKYFYCQPRLTDFYNSEPRATRGQLADVYQRLEKEEKAEGEHSGIILG